MGRDMMRLRRGILLNTPHEEQASGAVASFATDIGKLKECVVGIEPVQDLNGYGSPWPAGGGVNLLDPTQVTKYGTGAYGLTTSWDATTGAVTLSGTWTGSSSGGAWRLLNVPSSVRGYNVIGFSNSNNFSKFRWQADADMIVVEAKNMVKDQSYTIVAYPIVYSGTAPTSWTPYENICPISGWSEAKVYDDPKYDRTVWWNQQCAANNAVASYSKFGLTATAVQGKFAFDISGTYSYQSGDRNMYIFNMQNTNVLTAGHKYIVTNNSPHFCAYVYGAGSPSASVAGNKVNVANQGGAILTCTASGQYRVSLHCGANIPNNTQINETVYINLLDLTAMFGAGNEPSTVADFRALFPHDYYAYNAGEETLVSAVNGEPYRAIIVDLDGTRYGGTLDLLTGVLTVDKGFVEYDGSNDETWYSYDPDNYDSLCFNTPTIVNKKIGNSLSICNRFANVVAAWGAGGNGKYGVFSDHTTLARFYFRQPNANVSTIPQWKAWLSENPVTVVYPLATPFTVQLTPTQLRAIKGQNNIFADCGDVAVKYWKH